MRNLDGRSIAVGVLIGVAAVVSVGAARIPPSSPKCPWRLEMSRTTAEAWRLNTGTGQLEACMVGLGGEPPNPFTGAQCMPMPAPEAPGPTFDPNKPFVVISRPAPTAAPAVPKTAPTPGPWKNYTPPVR